MTGNERFEDSIGDWLQETAPGRLPERVLGATFERTRRTRQVPDWRAALRSLGTRRFIAALGSAAVLVLAFALALNVNPLVGPAGASPTPSATASAAASSGPTTPIWPQTSIEQAREAQRLADAGDARYTWQVSRDRWYQPAQHHPIDQGFFARFFEQELGWEKFLWDEAFAHPDGLVDGDVVFIRCAPVGANPLYPDDSAGGCAPTIDQFRYETVKINLAQPERQDASGIWVVTGWELIEPAEQVAPPSNTEIAAFLEPFLQARIDGEGVDDFAKFSQDDEDPDRADQPIPLLYATTNGLLYGRSEFAIVDGPVWPKGRMQLEVRLFAKNDNAVVEQAFSLDRDASGRLRLVYEPVLTGPDGPISGTTENGAAVPVEHAFLNGEVTFRAAYPLEPSDYGPDRLVIEGLLPNDDVSRRILLLMADPRPLGLGCEESAPTDAEALARILRSEPDSKATAPVAVTIGGLSGLQMDGVIAHATTPCVFLDPSGTRRARLYLLDLPGGSARVLAIAVSADEDSFETVLEWATPVIDSIEFHAP